MSHISVISVPVSDQDRAKAFYSDAVGFDVMVDSPFDSGRWVQLALPGTDTSISLVTWFEDFPPGMLRGLIIDVDDIAAEREKLSGRGVSFEDTFDTPYGKFAGFADPDGNRWSLHQQ